jgi:hypothetical protein
VGQTAVLEGHGQARVEHEGLVVVGGRLVEVVQGEVGIAPQQVGVGGLGVEADGLGVVRDGLLVLPLLLVGQTTAAVGSRTGLPAFSAR